MKRARLFVLLALGALGACGDRGQDAAMPADGTGAATPQRDVSTVVVLVLDSLRPDHTTPYGYGLDTTPHLAALAKEGTVWRDAVASCTGANAGLASVLTGKLASEHGVGSVHEPGRHRLADAEETLAERFAALGYRTFGAVALPQLGPLSGLDQGFETYLAPRLTESARDARQVWLDARPALDALLMTDEPVFLVLHLADARTAGGAGAGRGRDSIPPRTITRFLREHLAPLAAEREDLRAALAGLGGDPAGTLAELQRLLGRARGSAAHLALGAALYDGRVAFVDEHVGLLVELLRARGRMRDATVIALATRGAVLTPPRSTGGPAFLPELVSVPLIVRDPRGAGSRTKPGSEELDSGTTLAQPQDVWATLALRFGFDDEHPHSLPLGPVPVVREAARCESPGLERRAVFGLTFFVEDDPARGAVVFERGGAFVPRPAELEGAAAVELRELERALAGWDRPWARWSVHLPHEEDDAELRVEWSLLAGYARSAELGGDPVLGSRPASTQGRATLAAGQRLEVEASRRDAPLVLDLGWLGRELDESRTYLGATPLAELMLPRVPLGGAPWPVDAAGAPAPLDVSIERSSGSWWTLRVGADGEPGRRVEVLVAACPPLPPNEELVWKPVGAGALVPGRADAARLAGTTPFEAELQRAPRQRLALAVAIDGAVVPLRRMRVGGERWAPPGAVQLYLPDWLAGVTEGLASSPELPEPSLPGTVVVRRGVAATYAPASPAELELLRGLGGDE